MAMKAKPQVNLMLIASGSGTDAFSIMDAWKKGQIPEVGEIILVSTRADAVCLDKAASCGVESFTLVPPSIPLRDGQHKLAFQAEISTLARGYEVGVIFLVGCVDIVPLIEGVSMYNIHPADPDLYGGDGMYSLKPHESVMAAALDKIRRGKKVLGRDRFFTYPTVHEVTAIPDDGPPLLQGSVEIPGELLYEVLMEKCTLQDAADRLQKLVLPYEWKLLPAAVRMAARRILT